MSETIYVSPSSLFKQEYQSLWGHAMVISLDKRPSLTLLCSLLNVILNYVPRGGWVPYNHMLFTDFQEQLSCTCLHALLALLDFANPTSKIKSRSSPLDTSFNKDHE